MSAKQDILEAMIRDCKSCIYLYGKLKPGSLEYRPSEKQRSTLELLRYLRICGIATATAMLDGNWDRYQNYSEAAKTMKAEEFPAQMEEQIRQLQGLFQEISDEDWKKKKCKTPWGAELSLQRGMMELPMKFLSSYKLQLFLHAKVGNPEIGTKECWGSADLV